MVDGIQSIHNGNNKWKEAIDLETEQIIEYQVFTDVGKKYLQALPREKLYIVGGPEFEELQGHVLVMYKALYGTRSGGACWHYKFFDILYHMGFKTSEVDWDGHDPNPNHVNESLLSEVDWGAHNPDADDPEQLTGSSTSMVSSSGETLPAHVTTLSKLMVASS